MGLAKAAYRAVRFNPIVERLQNSIRKQRGVYFDAIDQFVEASVGDVIIDGGANVGVITSKCARTGATVHAFEPNPVCYRILKRRFAAQPNVTIHNKGLMDRNCTLTLSTPVPHAQFDGIQTTVAASFVAEDFGVNVTRDQIECVDIAEFINVLGKQVALLQLDIEGAEIAALNRLLDTGTIDRVKFAVVETHERFSEEQARQTDALRQRLAERGLSDRVRLDWI